MRTRKRQAWIVAFAALLFVARHGEARAERGGHFLPQLVATSFVRAILDGKVEVAVPLCAKRVSLDGRWVEGEKALRVSLAKLVTRARRERLRLRSLTMLGYDEMVARFGQPPARLANITKKRDMFALARLNRLGVVIGLERYGRLYRVKLVTD